MTRHLLFVLAVLVTIPAYGQRTLTCKSFTDRKTYCGFPPSGAAPVVQRQLSRAPCVLGTSWGVDKRGLWVANGCQAVFAMSFNNGPGNSYPPNAGAPGWWHPGPGNPAMWPPRGNWRGGNWGSGGACFYTRSNFRGDFFCMHRGDSYQRLDNFGDQISSFRVFGNARVIIYNDRNFRGGQSMIAYDVPNLKNFRYPNDPRHTWNNRISSIQVR